MKNIFMILLLLSCSGLLHHKLDLENSFLKVKSEISITKLKSILGKPDRELSHKKLGNNITAMMYYDDVDEQVYYRLAIYIDNHSNKVKSLSYRLRKSDRLSSIKDFEIYLKRKFLYYKKDLVPHGRAKHGYYTDQKNEYTLFVGNNDLKRIETVNRKFK